MTVFAAYAEYYDAIYSDKDYDKECDFIEHAFARYACPASSTLLDAGCGTGAHAIAMAQRGYGVTGVDRSADMLRVARAKTTGWDRAPVFVTQDLRHLSLNRLYDAVICMFGVLSYQLTTDDVLHTLTALRRHLRPGGLFVCDYWNGVAVLTEGTHERIKRAERGHQLVVRHAHPEGIDLVSQTNTTRYVVSLFDQDTLIHEIRETHRVRFFFPQEIIHYLRMCGFENLAMCNFPDLDSELAARSWAAAVVARAV